MAHLGGHLEGCRIGFDLGASDYKVAAVRDGEAVFSAEIPGTPRPKPTRIPLRPYPGRASQAAAHLPRVDAIGGSSAGVYVTTRSGGLAVPRRPQSVFERAVKHDLPRMQQEWGVPVVVMNDGDVTALAGAMSLGEQRHARRRDGLERGRRLHGQEGASPAG